MKGNWKKRMKVEKYIDQSIPSLEGKVILVTGANSGIGFEASRIFAMKKATLIFACRNEKKAEVAKEKILEEFPNTTIHILLYDQSSLSSIHHFVNEVTERFPKIDVTVCNAGIYHPKEHSYTEDQFPLTIGTNYIGTYYLLLLLMPHLEKNKEGRVIIVSSLTYHFHMNAPFKVLTEDERKVSKNYAISKAYLVKLFLYYVEHSPLKILLMHPGVASTNIYSSKDTHFSKFFMSLAHKVLPLFTHTPKKASLGIALLASQENIKTGTFLGPRGLFGWSGYPHKIKVSRKVKKNENELFEYTKQIVLEKEATKIC